MDPGRVIVAADLFGAELRPTRNAVYDREIGVRTLYEDPQSGAEHYLIRYPGGLQTRLHRHTAAHTIILLEGRLEVNGVVVSPGSYCHFPAGEAMRHAPVDDEPALFVIMFDGPSDAHPLE